MAENTNTCTNKIFKHFVDSEDICLDYCLFYDNAAGVKMPHYGFFVFSLFLFLLGKFYLV